MIHLPMILLERISDGCNTVNVTPADILHVAVGSNSSNRCLISINTDKQSISLFFCITILLIKELSFQ